MEEPRSVQVGVVVLDRLGQSIASNAIALYVAPSSLSETSGVMLSDRWDDDLDTHLRAGGRAVVFVSPGSLPGDAELAIEERAGGHWEGDWAQGMMWLRPEVWRGVGTGPRVGGVFEGLTPSCVITGYSSESARDVLGGYYLGWVRDMVATIGAFRHGAGAGILCAFPLQRHIPGDPLAVHLLNRLAALARVVEPAIAL